MAEYIAGCPKEGRAPLREVRAAIWAVVPDAIETQSCFDRPGYAYEGYAYSGMFVWFSFKAPFVRSSLRAMKKRAG